MTQSIPHRAYHWLTKPLLAALFATCALAASIEDRWWPVQALPKSIVKVANKEAAGPRRLAMDMMLQSVAGLAAKAVNDVRGDQMVWIENGNKDLKNWLSRMQAQHPQLEDRGAAEPWELIERYTAQGIVKGYILYRGGASKGAGDRINYSVNVATSLAGLLEGIVVEECLEAEAKARGLKLLMDVREKSQAWCFETYKDQFNRRMLCTQDPGKPHVRDLAIAQRVFTVFGRNDAMPAMAWLEPLSPILGWNEGDEFECTDLSSVYGHIQTATDWCNNLPILMAGSEKIILPKITNLDPRMIDWNDARSAVSFIDTDGDNVQWLQGNFFSADESRSYWGNPYRGKIPFGWSCCFAHLAQLCPAPIDYALATRSPNDHFIEWGGGYYYPDRFGLKHADRWDLLAKHARRTWELMRKTNTRSIGFNFANLDSADTRKACEVFAGQTDGLLAIFAFQYSAYEAGAGRVFWVHDRNDVEVPVITARYSIWENLNHRKGAGTPAKIAREIWETVEKAESGKLPRYDWVIAHVWSYLKRAPGDDEDAENMPQLNAATTGGTRGYLPVTWCAERLPASIRVVSPDELAWRIRMQHNPSQTRQVISQFK